VTSLQLARAAVLVALLAVPPIAAGESREPTSPAGRPVAVRALDEAGMRPGDVLDAHVAAVDRERGRLRVETERGPLELHAEPDDLDDVVRGDMIQVNFVEVESG